jgi:endonuclease YncB( thermonuclease family)
MALVFLLAFLGGGNVYEGRVIRVIDGDTIRVAIGIWPDEEVTAIRVRGVDTPELKARCPEEHALAQKAKAFTAGFLPAGSIVILRKIKADKYRGRYDADVQRSDGRELAAALIGAGLRAKSHSSRFWQQRESFDSCLKAKGHTPGR